MDKLSTNHTETILPLFLLKPDPFPLLFPFQLVKYSHFFLDKRATCHVVYIYFIKIMYYMYSYQTYSLPVLSALSRIKKRLPYSDRRFSFAVLFPACRFRSSMLDYPGSIIPHRGLIQSISFALPEHPDYPMDSAERQSHPAHPYIPDDSLR